MLFVVCCILLYEICIYHKQAAIAREWACVKIEHHCHLYFLLQMKMFKLYKVSHLISLPLLLLRGYKTTSPSSQSGCEM